MFQAVDFIKTADGMKIIMDRLAKAVHEPIHLIFNIGQTILHIIGRSINWAQHNQKHS